MKNKHMGQGFIENVYSINIHGIYVFEITVTLMTKASSVPVKCATKPEEKEEVAPLPVPTRVPSVRSLSPPISAAAVRGSQADAGAGKFGNQCDRNHSSTFTIVYFLKNRESLCHERTANKEMCKVTGEEPDAKSGTFKLSSSRKGSQLGSEAGE